MNESPHFRYPNTTYSLLPAALLVCLLLSGCSFLQTIESEQWVTMPVLKDGKVQNLVTPPAYILAKEEALIGVERAALLKQLAWASCGTIHCRGPANIRRRVKVGDIEICIETENSNWIAGINDRVTGAFKWTGETIASLGKTAADVML